MSFDYRISVSHDMRKLVMNAIKEREKELGIKSCRYSRHKPTETDQEKGWEEGEGCYIFRNWYNASVFHHERNGYLIKFNAIHKASDCVLTTLTMSTDRKNRYLFIGTSTTTAIV